MSHLTVFARRERVWTRTLVLTLLLLVPVGLPTAEAAYRQVDVSTEEVTAKSVVMVVPAVAELPDGTLRGVAMQMEATLRDGDGGVYVDTRPLTQVDMQGSARLAATMATSLSGATMSDHDFFITTRSPAPAVGGPSAGAAMTVAFTALLLGLPVRDDVVMTGMINPDGSVGPIGGILEKAEAAHEAGASLFLIPEGQAVVTRTVRDVEEGGWFPTVTTREERVDAITYARQEWGLEVREVSDIHAAVELATDHRIERPDVPQATGRPLFGEVMADASRDQLGRAKAEYDRLVGRVEAQNGSSRAQLTAVLARADEKLQAAAAASDNGSSYTASSRAFQALIDLRIVDLWLGALAAPDDRDHLQGRGSDAAEVLRQTTEAATAADPDTVSSLEAVGAAQVRVLEAERLLDQAELLLADDRLTETVEALAFGIERTRSVTWWLEIAEDLAHQDEGAELAAEPGELATDYFGIAQQAVIYAEVLLAQTGADETTRRLLQEGRQALEDAQAARQRGLQVGALYLAMEAQVAGHGALSLVGSTGLVADRVERQRDRALIQIARTRDVGAEPFLAVSYLEFAESLSGSQPVDALMMYGNAATIAATSGMLATGDICGFGGVSCGTEAPSLMRVAVPGADPWTAYFALATVVLGFMAGVLVTLVVLQTRDRRHTAHAGRERHPVPRSVPTATVSTPLRPRRHRAAVPPPTPGGRGRRREHVTVHWGADPSPPRGRAARPPSHNPK